MSETTVTVEEQADAAADFTRGLVVAFGYDAEVTTRRRLSTSSWPSSWVISTCSSGFTRSSVSTKKR